MIRLATNYLIYQFFESVRIRLKPEHYSVADMACHMIPAVWTLPSYRISTIPCATCLDLIQLLLRTGPPKRPLVMDYFLLTTGPIANMPLKSRKPFPRHPIRHVSHAGWHRRSAQFAPAIFLGTNLPLDFPDPGHRTFALVLRSFRMISERTKRRQFLTCRSPQGSSFSKSIPATSRTESTKMLIAASNTSSDSLYSPRPSQ